MPPSRRGDDNPLVAILMLGLLVVVVLGGLWHATRERPGQGMKSPGAEPQPEAGPPQTKSGPGPGNTPRFVAAFKRLPADAVALQQAADAEYAAAAGLLSPDERAQVEKILSRKGASRDSFSDDELATLRRHGFGKWVRAQAVRWSEDDPNFKTASVAVWARSPRARDGGLTELAAKWGEMNRSARAELLGIIQTVEDKSRELSEGERGTVIAFAGEEYFANRP